MRFLEEANGIIGELDLDAISSHGLLRNRDKYFLNISYPSLQAMADVADDSIETALLGANADACAVYVHVPFCTAECYYCHYYKLYRQPPEVVDSFLDALEVDFSLTSALYGGRMRASAIYVGGGTPSYLTAAQIRRLFRIIDRFVERLPGAEVSFELHPESCDQARLDELIGAGVNRFNLGVESFEDHTLLLENRRHTVEEVYAAMALFAKNDVQNFNIDLIYGLRDQKLRHWSSTLEKLIELAPPSITAYYLRIKRKTPEAGAFKRASHRYPSEDDLLIMHAMTIAALDHEANYVHQPTDWFTRNSDLTHVYQDFNWRKTDEVPLLGFGPSAYSYFAGVQAYKRNDLDLYMKSLADGRLPFWRFEELKGDDPARRSIMLGLKLGIDRRWHRATFDSDPVDQFPREWKLLDDLGLVAINNERIELTTGGHLFADEMGQLFYSDAMRSRMAEIDSDLVSTTWPSINP